MNGPTSSAAPAPRTAPVLSVRGRRRTASGHDRDRGSTSLELAIVTPVLFALIGTIVQLGLWYHAQAIALAAAQEGARAARVPAANEVVANAAGTSTARNYLDQLGSDILVPGSITITPARPPLGAQGGVGDVVSIRVRGDVVSVVPGLNLSVDEVSTVVVERFRPDS